MKPPSSKWILPMFARAPIFTRDLNVGHCFETLVVGHVIGTDFDCLQIMSFLIYVANCTAYGDSSFLALRGAVAQRFREYYARSIMCGIGSEKDVSMSDLCDSALPLLKGKQHAAHKINLYKKVGGSNGPVWEHLCRYDITLVAMLCYC